MNDLNRDVILAYDRYYRPRGYGYNMPEQYHGGPDDHGWIRQKKAEPILWDSKQEATIEQD